MTVSSSVKAFLAQYAYSKGSPMSLANISIGDWGERAEAGLCYTPETAPPLFSTLPSLPCRDKIRERDLLFPSPFLDPQTGCKKKQLFFFFFRHGNISTRGEGGKKGMGNKGRNASGCDCSTIVQYEQRAAKKIKAMHFSFPHSVERSGKYPHRSFVYLSLGRERAEERKVFAGGFFFFFIRERVERGFAAL